MITKIIMSKKVMFELESYGKAKKKAIRNNWISWLFLPKEFKNALIKIELLIMWNKHLRDKLLSVNKTINKIILDGLKK